MFEVTFLGKKEIAYNTWEFVFAKPTNFIFKPGQYTTIFLGKENRDFTICADPNDKKYFSIVTKLGKSRFKKNLNTLPLGSKITMSKPTGGFTVHKNKIPKVFLAGGIGMTVFYSIIKHIVSKKSLQNITLIASFSKKNHMIFYDELQRIQKTHKNITVIYTLSQDTGEEEGRISENHIKKYVPFFQKAEYMIAGGEKMVEDTEKLLLQMKIPEDRIRIDIFTGY